MAGRPRKPQGQSRTKILRVRLSEGERETLDQAAHVVGLDTSTWLRHELLSLARKILAKKHGEK
jgi:uncharacterized protein (DUF1778 family)